MHQKNMNSRKNKTYLSVLFLSVLLITFLNPLHASHFRGSNIAYELDNSNNLTVTVFAVWRSSFIGSVNVRIYAQGDTNRNFNLLSMTETSVEVVETGFEFPGGEAFTVRKHVFQSDISGLANGWYYARWEAGNRVTGIVNVGATRWGMETLVDFNASNTSNSSPVMIPATIDMIGIGLDWSQNLLASDPDGNPLSYQFIMGANDPQYGANSAMPGLTVDTQGQLFIPAASTATYLDERRYAYKVRVTDGTGSYAERDVLVVARNLYGNNQPNLASIGDKYIDAGNTLNFLVNATDADASDNLTLRMTSTPAGSLFDTQVSTSPVSGNFTWTNANPPGIYKVGFEVFDSKTPEGTILIDNEIVTIIVNGNNQFPILDPIGNKYTPYPGTISFTVSGSDAETVSSNLVYSASFLPTGATFNPTTRVFSWTPTVAQQGVWTGIVFRVTDDDPSVPLYDEEAITISVNDNQSPTFAAISNQTIDISQNLSLALTATDVDGDTVTFSLLSEPGGSTFSQTSGVTATANLQWTPSTTGIFSFNVRAQDNSAFTLSQDRNFNVTVIKNTTPSTPTLTSPLSNSFLSDTTPSLTFSTNDIDTGNLKYQIQISTDPTFATTTVDYTSDFITQGSTSFTVGQSAGTGSYTTGSTSSVLSPGNWYWRTRSTDTMNWTSDYSTSGNSSVAFIVNSTPAYATFTTPIGGNIISSPPTFQFNISDPDNTSLYYHLQVSSDSGFNAFDINTLSALTSPGAISTNPGSLNGGQYYWRVQTTDPSASSAGLAYADSGAIAFTIDNQPNDPSNLTVSTDHGMVTLSAAPNFNFYISDTDNQVRYNYKLTYNSNVIIDYTSALMNSGNTSFTVGQSPTGGFYTSGNTGQTLSSGSYTWTVQAISTYGRVSNTISGTSFTKNTVPTISSLTPNSVSSYFIQNSANPSFSFNIADAESQQVNYALNIYKQDSSTPIYSTGPGSLQTAGNISVSANQFTDLGNYYWTIQAYDSLGSSSIITATGPGFIVVSAPPTSSIIYPINNQSTNPGTIDYRFAIDDPTDKTVRYEIKVTSYPTGNVLNTYTEPNFAAEGYFNNTSSNLAMTNRGDYNWQIRPINDNGSLGGTGNILYSTEFSNIAYSVSNVPNSSNVSISNSFTFNSNTFISTNTPSFTFDISDSDPDPLKYTLVVDDSSDYSSPVISYTSPFFADNFSENIAQSNLIYHWTLDEIISTTSPNRINESVPLNTNNSYQITGKHGRGIALTNKTGALTFDHTSTTYSEFSLSMWLNTHFSGNANTVIPILIAPTIDLHFIQTGASNTMELWNNGVADVYDITYSDNTWTHFLVSGNSNKVNIYINNQLANHTTANARTNFSFPTGTYTIGGNVLGSRTDVEYWNTQIDDIRFYSKELTSSERTALMSIPNSVSTNISHTIGSTGSSNSYLYGLPTTTLAGGQYYYKVNAIDPFGWTSTANIGSFIINTTPTDPTNLLPNISQTTTASAPLLSFNGSDPEGGLLKYRLRIALDNNFATPILDYSSPYLNKNNFTFYPGQYISGETWHTGDNTTRLSAGRYNFDIQIFDQYEFTSNIVKAHTSHAFTVNQPPQAPIATSPINSSLLRSFQPSFIFYTSDPDGSVVGYTITVDDDSNFGSPEIIYQTTPVSNGNQLFTTGQALGSGSYTSGYVGQSLAASNYFWKVDVLDTLGGTASVTATTSSSGYAFKLNDLPNAPVLTSPIDGSESTSLTPSFNFTLSDNNNDTLFYTIEISSDASFSIFDTQYRLSNLTPNSYTYATSQTGNYLTGQAGRLQDGNYYWRLNVSDNLDSSIVTSTANSGAVAFSINSAPILSGNSEINPGGAIQSTFTTYELDLTTIHSTTNHGFDRIEVSFPSTFSTSANSTSSLTFNGSSNLTGSVSSNVLTISLPSTINANSTFKIGFELQNPTNAEVSQFQTSVYNSLYNKKVITSEGDGDNLNNGGAMTVQIQAAGAALMALSEILPIQTTQATVTDFTLYNKTLQDSTTSGIDVYSVIIPQGYQLINTNAFTSNGSSISYTTSIISGNKLDLTLNTRVSQSSNLTFKFQARTPLTPGTKTFKGQVQTAISLKTTEFNEGDGNLNNDGGSLTVDTQPVGPALLAEAEVLPSYVIKGSTDASYQLFIYANCDPSTSGLNQIVFDMPTDLIPVQTGLLRFAGSSITYTSSVSSNTYTLTLPSLINTSGVYSIDLVGSTSSIAGTSSITQIKVNNTNNSSSLPASEGDGDYDGQKGSLSLSRVANGPASLGLAEINPNVFIKATENSTALHLNVGVSPKNSGFNRVRFEIPSHIEQTTITSVKWNNLSIAYSTAIQSYQTDPSDSSELAHIYYLNPSSLLDTDGILTVNMDVYAKNEIIIDSFTDIHVAYTTDSSIIYSTSTTKELYFNEGDGDNLNNGGDLSFEIRSAGPASDAVSEVLPTLFTKGLEQTFNYYVYPTIDIKHNGVNYFEINLGSDISNIQLNSIKRDGLTVSPLSTSVSGNVFKFITPLASYSSVFNFEFKGTLNSTTGYYTLPAAIIDYTTASSISSYSLFSQIQSNAGDGDHTYNGGTLQYQTVPAGPALNVISEILPNKAIKGSQKTFSYFFNINIDNSSSGVDTLKIQLPASFSGASLTNVYVNNSSITYSNLSNSSLLHILLNTKITQSSIVKVEFNANLPTDPITETFGFATVDDSSFTFPRTVSEGDGDGNNDSGSLTVNTVAKAVVLSAKSEISNTTPFKAQRANFEYLTALEMDVQTSGVAEISMTLPVNFTNIAVHGINVNNSSVSYTSSSSGQVINFTLNQVISTSSSLNISFSADMPPYETRETLPGLSLKNGTLTDLSTEGDGNLDNKGGSLTIQTIPTGPAVRGFAEVKPNLLIKGSTAVSYQVFIYSESDLSTSGVDQIQFTLPTELTNTQVSDVKFSGSSIAFTSNITNQVVTLTFPNAIDFSGVYSIDLNSDTDSNEGTSSITSVLLKNNIHSSIKIIEAGDGDQDGNQGTLAITRIANGPITQSKTEFLPQKLIKASENQSSVHFDIQVSSQNSGFNRVRFEVPSEIIQSTVSSVQWNGTSIPTSHEIESTPLVSTTSNTIYIKTDSLINTSGQLKVNLDVFTQTVERTVSLSNIFLSYSTESGIVYSTSTTSEIQGIEGDGDKLNNGGSLSFSIQSAGPSSDVSSEVLPTTYTKGIKNTFTYYIYPQIDNRHDGVNYIEIPLGNDFSQIVFRGLKVNGSTVNILEQANQQNTFKFLIPKLSISSVLAFEFEALFPSITSTYSIPKAKIDYTQSSTLSGYSIYLPVQSNSGDGDHQFNGGTLQYNTLPEGPALEIFSEVQPNRAIKASTFQQFSYFFNINIDTSSSGVNVVSLKFPKLYTNATLLNVKVNGLSVNFTDQSTTTLGVPELKALLTNKVTTDSIVELVFLTTTPDIESIEKFSIASVDDTSFNFPRNVLEGDGDGQNNGGSLSIETVSKAVVISAKSELSKNQAIKAARTSFTLYTAIQTDKQTSGVKEIDLTLPFSFTSPTIDQIKVNGASLLYTSSNSSTTYTLTLDETVTDSSVISIEFSATMPSFETRERIPDLSLKNGSLINKTTIGDGNKNGVTGSMVIETIPKGPVAEAFAEISPNEVIKSSKNIDYTLAIKTIPDASSSHIRNINLSIPTGFTNFKLNNIQVDGTSVLYSSSFSSNIFYTTLSTLLLDESLIEMSLTGDSPLDIVNEAFQPITLVDSNDLSYQVVEGLATTKLSEPHSWNVKTLSAGAGRSLVAEILPNSSKLNQVTLFKYFINQIQDSSTSPIKRITLDLPVSFTNVSVSSVQVNGSSVTQTSSINNNQIELLFLKEVSKSAIITIIFNATPVKTGSENFPGASTWYTWDSNQSSDLIKSIASEGDGDNQGFNGSNSLKVFVFDENTVIPSKAEITPNTVATNSQSDFTYSVYLESIPTSGIDRFEYSLPNGYSNLILNTVQWKGSSISYTQSSTTKLSVILSEPITEQGVLSFKFSALTPSIIQEDLHSLMKVGNVNDLLFVTEGDGDNNGGQGINSLKVNTLISPPVSFAITEIYPNTISVDTQTDFNLNLNVAFTTNSGGLTHFDLKWPLSYTTPVIQRVKLSNQSISYTSSFGSQSIRITPNQKIDTNNLINVQFNSQTFLSSGSENFPLPTLYSDSSSMKPVIGDTDNNGISPYNSLNVTNKPRGPVQRVVSEISPNQVISALTDKTFEYHLYVEIGKAPSFTGFDTIELTPPSTYQNFNLQSVKVDGSSVYFNNLSDSNTIRAKLTQALLSDPIVNRKFVISLSFSCQTTSQIISESFSEAQVYLSTNSNLKSIAVEGDGDRGIAEADNNSWTVIHKKSLPCEEAYVEVSPNQFNVNQSNQKIDLYLRTNIEKGNSGIHNLEIALPQSIQVISQSLTLNGVNVGVDQSTSKQIKYLFAPSILFDGVFKLSMVFNTGATSISDQFSNIKLFDEFGNVVVALEGDGDLNTAGIGTDTWSFSTVSNKPASRIQSNISPSAFNTGVSQTMSYITLIELNDGDKGFDTLKLGIPSQLTGVSLQGVYINNNPGTNPNLQESLADSFKVNTKSGSLNGQSLKTSLTPSSTSGFEIVLDNSITQSSLVEIRFSATIPTENDTAIEFSQFAISNSSDPSNTQTAVFDDSNSWNIAAYEPRAVLQAIAEISPNTVVKAIEKQQFHYYLKTSKSNDTGYDRISFSFPVTYSDFEFVSLINRSNGTSAQLNVTPQITDNNMIISLPSSYTDASFEIIFKATVPSTELSERFSLIDVYLNTDNNPVQVEEGDTGLTTNTVHSLKVDSSTSTLISTVYAEVTPNVSKTPNENFDFTYQTKVTFPQNSSGIDYFALTLPNEMIGTRLKNIRVNGQMILYEDASFYNESSFTKPAGGQHGGSIVVKLPAYINTDSTVEFFMNCKFRPNEKDISLSEFIVSRMPIAQNTQRSATQGDAGTGENNSWTITLNPPVPGIRSLSDYPLFTYNSGDYVTPTVVGFGKAGERVEVRRNNGELLGTATADENGFFISQLSLLQSGTHGMYIDFKDLSGNTVSTTNNVSYTVLSSESSIPTTDSDYDGILDFDDIDDDGDGIVDIFDRYPLDFDNDQVQNSLENDLDGDGLSNSRELELGLKVMNKDSNADGIIDSLQLSDTDGDGWIDAIDTNVNTHNQLSDHDGDGIPDFWDKDNDNDGIIDSKDLTPFDRDEDGLNHFIDQDDDNDGILDTVEISLGLSPNNSDTNGDGIPDTVTQLDSDGDGIIDSLDTVILANVIDDMDKDGLADKDDEDIDGDGLKNKHDPFPIDHDNDGINDILDKDNDNDGILDTSDSIAGTDLSRDSDQDSLPNAIDPDDDGDGIKDSEEGLFFSLDANNDQNINSFGESIFYYDKDGVKDEIEHHVGSKAQNSDTNGDGVRDSGDLANSGDDDGDGIYNDIDPAPKQSNTDTNLDGQVDILSHYLNTISTTQTPASLNTSYDSDGDQILNIYDHYPFDSDNDGIPNSSDNDKDGDGSIESGSADLDSDNDGILNSNEQDSDNDGFSDLLERVLATNPYQDTEKDYIKPNQDYIKTDSFPIRNEKATYGLDWSYFTNNTNDKAVQTEYDASKMLLPTVPVWKVNPEIDLSDRPHDHIGPLYGQYELQLNQALTGQTMQFVIPFQADKLTLGRRYEFLIWILNENYQWEKADASFKKSDRFFIFNLPPHRAAKIYIKDFGNTIAPAENNSSGGCFLK